MKLINPEFFCPIELSENELATLIIENPLELTKLVLGIREAMTSEESDWLLSNEGKLLNMSKACEILTSPLDVDINHRKLIDALYDDINERIKCSELLRDWSELYTFISQKLDKFIAEVDFAVTYTDDIDCKKFLKFMQLCYVDDSEDYFEKLIIYFRMASRVLKRELFILVGFKMFLTKEQLTYLIESMSYEKYQILFIEGGELIPKIKEERITIIDTDGCVINL